MKSIRKCKKWMAALMVGLSCFVFFSNSFAEEKGSSIKVGDSITWGKYEQDGKTTNGLEDIEWNVLKIENDKMLVVTKDGIDICAYFDDPSVSILDVNYITMSWEKSTIRKWLNGTFFTSAFTAEEQEKIVLSDLVTKDVNGETITTDRVFLLSRDEVKECFGTSNAMVCKPSKYAKSKIIMEGAIDKNGYGLWWLRDVINQGKKYDEFNEIAVVVQSNGIQTDNVANAPWTSTGIMVRPAMWISIEENNSPKDTIEDTVKDEKENSVTNDIESMSYDELVALKDKINLAMWNSKEWKEVRVPQGVYTVGEDIPEGKWTIKAGNAQCVSLTWCDKLDASGMAASFESEIYVYKVLIDRNNAIYETGNEEETTFTMKNGQFIIVELGEVIFTPYAGKKDLGFN